MSSKKSKKDRKKEYNILAINILAVFKQNPYTLLNYKQVAGKLGIGKGAERA